MGRALLLGVTFANLVYLRVWSELLNSNPEDLFLHRHRPYPAQYLALIANVLAMGIATSILIRLAPRFPKLVRAVLLISGIVLVLSSIRATFYLGQSVSPIVVYSVAAAVLVAAFWFALKDIAKAEQIAGYMLLVISPFLFVTFPQAIRFAIFPPRQPAEPPLAAFQAASPARRVVWVIFDEWDYRLTFVDRPAGLAMPVVDRFREQSFSADDAVPPGGATLISMPALLQNHQIKFNQLGAEPNIFSRVQSRGWNAGVAGWYLPYCRVFASVLSSCYWDELHDLSNSGRTTFTGALQDQARSLVESNRRSFFGATMIARRHSHQYEATLEKALTMVADPRLAATLLHLNVPHGPFFYDARTRSHEGNLPIATGYPNALALLDDTLAELLQTLSQSGLASQTALIISSDHWLRASSEVDGKVDHHVPFLLYLPNGGPGLRYEKEFPTLLTQDLILDLLDNRLQTYTAISDWISVRTGPPPSGAVGH